MSVNVCLLVFLSVLCSVSAFLLYYVYYVRGNENENFVTFSDARTSLTWFISSNHIARALHSGQCHFLGIMTLGPVWGPWSCLRLWPRTPEVRLGQVILSLGQMLTLFIKVISP